MTDDAPLERALTRFNIETADGSLAPALIPDMFRIVRTTRHQEGRERRRPDYVRDDGRPYIAWRNARVDVDTVAELTRDQLARLIAEGIGQLAYVPESATVDDRTSDGVSSP